MATQYSEFSTGACLCKRVRFRVRNPPNYNALTVGHVESDIQSYVDTSTDSGKPLTRQWCGNCGSPLFERSALTPSIVSIPAGILDEGSPWAPKVEQYCRSRARWLPELKGVESFEAYPSAEERVMAGAKAEKGEVKKEGEKNEEDDGKKD
ncbi:hypothetical protein K490DRAFT_66987 [Saccharata proteae CBS 121410]|uniref:CENP-V/GFA domain-containing protein n=1 Tax=Saccharata proteae CBS 121410 TaxID=1314787 RepID=A0A9P4HUW7_9PEZI|nr:hypothetical protein K490DRAFT_66987 [Saccharata proteae CBS 121410]